MKALVRAFDNLMPASPREVSFTMAKAIPRGMNGRDAREEKQEKEKAENWERSCIRHRFCQASLSGCLLS